MWASAPRKMGMKPEHSGGSVSLTVRQVKGFSLERSNWHTFATPGVPSAVANHSKDCSPAC